MDIIKQCEKLNYFIVYTNYTNYMISSFDNSISLNSLMQMGLEDIKVIKGMNKNTEIDDIKYILRTYGVRFIETMKLYNPNELNLLKEDYFIMTLANLVEWK